MVKIVTVIAIDSLDGTRVEVELDYSQLLVVDFVF